VTACFILERVKILTAALRKFIQDDGTFLASGLAFGLLFYSVPFTLLTVSALGYAAVNSDTAEAWIRRLSLNLIPHSRDLFDGFVMDVVARRGVLGFFGFISFLLASSTTFGSVRLVLNRVFGGREQRGLVRGKIMEVAMMFGTSLLFFSPYRSGVHHQPHAQLSREPLVREISPSRDRVCWLARWVGFDIHSISISVSLFACSNPQCSMRNKRPRSMAPSAPSSSSFFGCNTLAQFLSSQPRLDLWRANKRHKFV